jgi:UDP-xylose/UDP-N-acetylglucosamine transporter B4
MGELDAPPKARRDNAAAIARAIALIALGCVANNFLLELIISRKKNPHADPAAGGLLTLIQFAVVAAASAPHGVAWRGFGGGGGWLRGLLPLRVRAPVVPFRHYAGMTLLFFSMSYLNNAAFAFHISQPLHMVFRSSSLMVTYAISRACFGKRYSRQQLAAVLLLTLGALAATAAEALLGDTASAAAAASSGRALAAAAAAANGTAGGGGGAGGAAQLLPAGSPCAGGAGCGDAAARALGGGGAPALDVDGGAAYLLRWGAGMAILVGVLVLQTLLGNYQNWAASTFGKAPQEGMFWSHTLSLPVFVLGARDLAARGAAWAASPPLREALAAALPALLAPGAAPPRAATTAGLLGWRALRLAAAPLTHGPLARLPLMWALVLANALTQLVCVSGVYRLTAVSDPLTVNVTLTVRKCVSLLLSIAAFGNTFTPPHWLGAGLVFGGALLYGVDLGAWLGGGGARSGGSGGGRGGAGEGAAAAGASARGAAAGATVRPPPAAAAPGLGSPALFSASGGSGAVAGRLGAATRSSSRAGTSARTSYYQSREERSR